jgi:molybdopterin molybdotransferase
MTPPLRDDRSAIRAAVENALKRSDLIAIVGGASVGDHDHARTALSDLGTELLVDKVSVRPGKPTWFGLCGAVPVLGLPGNPASALVCARLFLRPLLDKMLGRDPAQSVAVQRARLRGSLKGNGPRESYLRGRSWLDDTGQLWAEAFVDQDSSLMRIYAASNCLIVQAPHAPACAHGDGIETLPL